MRLHSTPTPARPTRLAKSEVSMYQGSEGCQKLHSTSVHVTSDKVHRGLQLHQAFIHGFPDSWWNKESNTWRVQCISIYMILVLNCLRMQSGKQHATRQTWWWDARVPVRAQVHPATGFFEVCSASQITLKGGSVFIIWCISRRIIHWSALKHAKTNINVRVNKRLFQVLDRWLANQLTLF